MSGTLVIAPQVEILLSDTLQVNSTVFIEKSMSLCAQHAIVEALTKTKAGWMLYDTEVMVL
jgi:hypothetical protein